MNSFPRITIIIPVYNLAKYIVPVIPSAIDQTHPENY